MTLASGQLIPTIKMKSRKKVRTKTPITLYREAVTDALGPIPENPLRSLRYNGRIETSTGTGMKTSSFDSTVIKGRSLSELSGLCRVSKQAIIRTEQGVYPEIPKGILEYLIKQGVPYLLMVNGYEEFQLAIRRRHFGIFGHTQVEFKLEEHPNKTLRNRWTYPTMLPVGFEMNITEQAKLLCISQSVLNHFESHPNRQQSVPYTLNRALSEANYSVAFLEQFSQAYKNHRQWLFDQLPSNLVSGASK